jgi:hypothetical protein
MIQTKLTLRLLLPVALLLLPALDQAAFGQVEVNIDWNVSSAGGRTSSSAAYSLSGSFGQMAVGNVVAPNHGVYQGYWQVLGMPLYYLCGDVDSDNQVNVTDIVFLINRVFMMGPPPSSRESGDVDCNGRVGLSDVVYLIQFVFGQGAVPCAGCPI